MRLVRSKGVGIFFVTQNPKDVPPDDPRPSSATACSTRCAPSRPTTTRRCARRRARSRRRRFYDVEETLTTLGIGEALVTVLSDNGAPTPPFVTRVAPPASRMGPLTPAELAPLLGTEQVRHYATAVDRESAHEILGQRIASPGGAGDGRDQKRHTPAPAEPKRSRPPPHGERPWSEALRSPVARTIANQVTRGLMGALLGKPPRRRRTRTAW